jgi:hypothetical protein
MGELAMNARPWVVLVAAAGLLAGTGAYFRGPGSARAQDEQYEERSGDEADYNNRYRKNPKIRCLPYIKAPPEEVPKAPRKFLTHYRHQRCNECHQSPSPVAGRGDRPKAMAGTGVVVNASNDEIEYEAKYGTGDWEKFRLKPGKGRRHTKNYPTEDVEKDKRQSRPVWVRYRSAGEWRTYRLELVATPKKEFGNIYYFERRGGDVKFVSLPGLVSRPEPRY